MFRTDSPATKATNAYFKWIEGRTSYLATLLVPLIKEVIANPSNHEVDPEKLEKGDIKTNTKNLLATTQKFFDRIIRSQDACPGYV